MELIGHVAHELPQSRWEKKAGEKDRFIETRCICQSWWWIWCFSMFFLFLGHLFSISKLLLTLFIVMEIVRVQLRWREIRRSLVRLQMCCPPFRSPFKPNWWKKMQNTLSWHPIFSRGVISDPTSRFLCHIVSQWFQIRRTDLCGVGRLVGPTGGSALVSHPMSRLCASWCKDMTSLVTSHHLFKQSLKRVAVFSYCFEQLHVAIKAVQLQAIPLDCCRMSCCGPRRISVLLRLAMAPFFGDGTGCTNIMYLIYKQYMCVT